MEHCALYSEKNIFDESVKIFMTHMIIVSSTPPKSNNSNQYALEVYVFKMFLSRLWIYSSYKSINASFGATSYGLPPAFP